MEYIVIHEIENGGLKEMGPVYLNTAHLIKFEAVSERCRHKDKEGYHPRVCTKITFSGSAWGSEKVSQNLIAAESVGDILEMINGRNPKS